MSWDLAPGWLASVIGSRRILVVGRRSFDLVGNCHACRRRSRAVTGRTLMMGMWTGIVIGIGIGCRSRCWRRSESRKDQTCLDLM